MLALSDDLVEPVRLERTGTSFNREKKKGDPSAWELLMEFVSSLASGRLAGVGMDATSNTL